MNRRGFLRAAFASTAAIVVAPAGVLEELDRLQPRKRTYVDMGKNTQWANEYCIVNVGDKTITLTKDIRTAELYYRLSREPGFWVTNISIAGRAWP